jgi:hypothetical protein
MKRKSLMSNSSKWENNCAEKFHIKILSSSELESLMCQAPSLTINNFRLPSFSHQRCETHLQFCLCPLQHSRSRWKPHGCGAKRPKEGGLLWAPDGSAAFSVFGRSGFTGRCVRLVSSEEPGQQFSRVMQCCFCTTQVLWFLDLCPPTKKFQSPWEMPFFLKLEFWDVYKYVETVFAKH